MSILATLRFDNSVIIQSDNVLVQRMELITNLTETHDPLQRNNAMSSFLQWLRQNPSFCESMQFRDCLVEIRVITV